MSASCSTDTTVTADVDLVTSLETITVRLSAAEKQRFRMMAAARGLSEARLGLIAIRGLLDDAVVPRSPNPTAAEPASERITIRLRPGDRLRIGARAAERGMKDAGYLAALVRAHVVANPPIPTAELRELKQAVAALVRAIAELSANARELARTPEYVNTLWDDLRKIRERVIALERQFHAYTKAAIVAWEASSG
jgi:predicted DNA binding CopG/RHH family protein